MVLPERPLRWHFVSGDAIRNPPGSFHSTRRDHFMSASSLELLASDRQHFLHPSTHAHDHWTGALPGRIISGGNGIRIVDHEGNSFIDAFAGLYCVNIGYGRLEVAEAMYQQA